MECCTRSPTDPEELTDFVIAAYWLMYQQERLPPDLHTIEVLVCLEKPQPGSEGVNDLFMMDRIEGVCKQHGLVFRTVYRRT